MARWPGRILQRTEGEQDQALRACRNLTGSIYEGLDLTSAALFRRNPAGRYELAAAAQWPADAIPYLDYAIQNNASGFNLAPVRQFAARP